MLLQVLQQPYCWTQEPSHQLGAVAGEHSALFITCPLAHSLFLFVAIILLLSFISKTTKKLQKQKSIKTLLLLIMSSKVNFVQQIIQALEETKDTSLSSLVARHELIKKLLDQLERHSLWLRANDGSYCTNCITYEHLNFQCKYSDNPTLANYNRDKSYASLEVVEYVLFIGASEMVLRLGSNYVK